MKILIALLFVIQLQAQDTIRLQPRLVEQDRQIEQRIKQLEQQITELKQQRQTQRVLGFEQALYTLGIDPKTYEIKWIDLYTMTLQKKINEKE